SSLPLDVAQAFRAHFGLNELYLADLDAIAGAEPAWSTYSELHTNGFRLWVDAGVRAAAQAKRLAEREITVVVGLETVSGPEELKNICGQLNPDCVVFSLDLKGGQPLGDATAWNTDDAWTITEHAITLGVNRLIVLDLERVGMDGGTGTEDL